MYDVRCTIAIIARFARDLAEQVRTGCRETMRGVWRLTVAIYNAL